MGSLVLELQREALDSKVNVTDLLRKALVVARKLGIGELQLWVESELGGYTKGLSIPEYRIVRGQPKFQSPYGDWIEVSFEPRLAEIASLASRSPVGQPIGEIESLLKRKGETCVLPYVEEMEQTLMRLQGPPPLRPALMVDSSTLSGVIDSVRTVVLNWTLKLEEDGILGEGMTFTREEKQVASSHVYNIQNFIGSMTQSQIQQDARDSVQTMSVGGIDVSKVLSVLEEIKAAVAGLSLPRETGEELAAEIATAEAQARSPKPKERIIRESLRSIRNIAEGTAGELVAAGILEKLKVLLGGG